MKKGLSLFLCIAIMFSVTFMSVNDVEASASNKAMKFLKGTWVTMGNSQSVKVVFTKKYRKSYSLWSKDYTKVYSPKKKGKYMGKSKIVSTKKKGKKWIIKVGKKGSYTYYKGCGNVLECWWKDENGWNYSGSSSLERVK